MRPLLRIRLRTVFLLFVCAAFGLATYPDPLGAIEPAIATAMVIGLLQQARQLWLSRSGEKQPEIRFARQFALAWRVLVATIIATCVIVSLFYAKDMLPLDDEQKAALFFNVLFPIASISSTAVLCNSVSRWGPEGSERPRKRLLVWILAAILALFVVVKSGLLAFLVHESVADIEAAIPIRFQRPGFYPDLRNEGFCPFWIAATATVSLVLATGTLIHVVQHPTPNGRTIKFVISGFLLVAPVLFSYWFYFLEFHRLSPELAGSGLEAGWIQWLVGGGLAAALVTASAYRLARKLSLESVISTDMSQQTDSTALHESAPIVFLIAVYSSYSITLQLVSSAQVVSWFTSPHPVLFYISAFWYPTSLLALAQAASGLQLCWIRYRRRSRITPWVMPGLSRPLFLQSWVVLLVLLVIAIPTLNAFAFIAWLGPLNLRPLFGF